MPETRVVRIDEQLVAAAEAEGETLGRSTSAQLTHWARVGRAVEASGVPATSIRAVLEQQASFDDLPEEDQATVAALWSQQIDERLHNLDMAAHHEALGTPYAELDDDGNVVVIEPTPSAAGLVAIESFVRTLDAQWSAANLGEAFARTSELPAWPDGLGDPATRLALIGGLWVSLKMGAVLAGGDPEAGEPGEHRAAAASTHQESGS